MLCSFRAGCLPCGSQWQVIASSYEENAPPNVRHEIDNHAPSFATLIPNLVGYYHSSGE